MSQNISSQAVGQEAFGLGALLEFVTLCGVLAGLSRVVGPAASVCLMLLALALWARQGVLALALFLAVLLAAAHAPMSQWTAQPVAMAFAGLLCAWYAARRKRMTRATEHAAESDPAYQPTSIP